jgi:hypothetical protein
VVRSSVSADRRQISSCEEAAVVIGSAVDRADRE